MERDNEAFILVVWNTYWVCWAYGFENIVKNICNILFIFFIFVPLTVKYDGNVFCVVAFIQYLFFYYPCLLCIIGI